MHQWAIKFPVAIVLSLSAITCLVRTKAQRGTIVSVKREPKYSANASHSELRLQVAMRAGTYNLTITNLTDGPVTMERRISVERRTSSDWVHEMSIEAVAQCEGFDERGDRKSPVRLEAHADLEVVPWNGWLCGGQCSAACMQNVPVGPGTHRFVVVTVPDGRRITSPTFSIEPVLRLSVVGTRDTLAERAKSYGLTIENLSDQDVTIMRGISIWKKQATGWSRQLGSIQAVSKCDDLYERYRLETPVRISGLQSLVVVPWDGFLCAGQCPAACAKNYQLGPGTFRYEVVTLPDDKITYSPSFTIEGP